MPKINPFCVITALLVVGLTTAIWIMADGGALGAVAVAVGAGVLGYRFAYKCVRRNQETERDNGNLSNETQAGFRADSQDNKPVLGA